MVELWRVSTTRAGTVNDMASYNLPAQIECVETDETLRRWRCESFTFAFAVGHRRNHHAACPSRPQRNRLWKCKCPRLLQILHHWTAMRRHVYCGMDDMPQGPGLRL